MTANKDGGVSTFTAAAIRRPIRSGAFSPFAGELDQALGTSQQWLLDEQHADGFWVGELEGDSILESEYLLLMAYLGREREPLCLKIAASLRDQQQSDGGWGAYPGGPFELSTTVKAYFALKLTGTATDEPHMVRARELILAAGGAQGCNSFTRFYLALLGQMSYDETPCVPPELVLLPPRLGFSLYEMSSWTRTIVVPLSIISALKPVHPVPEGLGIPELFRTDLPRIPSRRSKRLFTWTNFFLAVNRTLKRADRVLPARCRRRAIQAAYRWMLERCEDSDGLGAIFPPMIYNVVALDCLGYARDSAEMRWALQQLEDLLIVEDESAHIQPCVSPIWDTAIAMIALVDSGLPRFHPALMDAARWLLAREIRRPGDWSLRRPGVEPGGWPFEYRNGFYPDIDDTAMVLMALHRTARADDPEVHATTDRAIAWLLAMQNKDGGWAAFDADIDNEVLTKVPFADHNAMLDPSCADITARVVEMLGGLGHREDHPAIARALDYLWRNQEPEGCWYGRWGVNYIYGTWQVLLGLKAIDFPMDHPGVLQAIAWLESTQQPNGGWGESCASYDDPSLKGVGPTTASQTAWAIMGLLAAGRWRSEAVRRGIDFLLATQLEDGTWAEPEFTGTGFPRVFYLKYHLYRVYFPIMAISRYRAAVEKLSENTVPTTAAYACRVPALPLPRGV